MEALRFIILDSDSIAFDEGSVKIVGGKALGLHQLKSLGIRLPSWATITTGLFRNVFSRYKDLNRLLMSYTEFSGKAKLIREHLRHLEFESSDKGILLEVWGKISQGGKLPVAVRSSAADEDSKNLSFAGQMETFLNIRDREGFLSAVCGCWASLFGERAVLYRINNGIDPWACEIAVIVQEMVESEVSGVIFTANPLTGNREEMLISSTWGLGEGLVSGKLDADNFILDSTGNIKESNIVEKKQLMAYDTGGGIRTIDVPIDKQGEASLTKGQLGELHKMALNVQGFKGMPMDIEFAIYKEKVYLLQARPITNLKEQVKPGKDNFNVWDNSNIVESYSGVTTPLTFSFIKKAYFAVYWQFWETIGVDGKTISENRHILENMLGLIQGRVYYNLLNWYFLISKMPGFKYNKSFMEQMMGLQVIKDYVKPEESGSKFEKYFILLPRLLRVGLKMFSAHLSLPVRIREFFSHFRKIYSYYSKLDYEHMPSKEILKVYRILEDEILWKWKAPILNDFEAMIFYGLLKKLTVNWDLDKDGSLQNDLLCGEGGITSTKVVTELFSIAGKIEANKELRSLFLELSPGAALLRLRGDPIFSKINAEFNRYLDVYGVRSVEEMKLESVPVKDDPTFCISMLQNYLRNTVPDPVKQGEHEQEIRARAEKVLKDKLRGKKALLFISKLRLYKFILKNARSAIKNRENQRLARAEAYSLARTLIRAIGKNWQEKSLIDKVEDIFYLELDEISSFIEGTAVSTDLRELVRIRRKEFEGYRLTNPDDHIETYGEVYYNNIFTKEELVSGEGVLKGLGCCQGVVEREVQVIMKPDSSVRLSGEIMVARQTDPGWVVLFPSISGLIVEKGSMLSHSAIVAREMGIPAVVGVKNATKLLTTGDKVRLDGAEGTISILERAGGTQQ